MSDIFSVPSIYEPIGLDLYIAIQLLMIISVWVVSWRLIFYIGFRAHPLFVILSGVLVIPLSGLLLKFFYSLIDIKIILFINFIIIYYHAMRGVSLYEHNAGNKQTKSDCQHNKKGTE